MAASTTTGSGSGSGTTVTGTGSGSLVYSRRIHKYHWPAIQLNIWMLIMLIASLTIIGVFGTLIGVQHQLGLWVPWYFPYFITVAVLTVVFIGALLGLILQRRLLPAIVILGAFVLFVLWLVGLVATSIELWGPDNTVSANCQLYVFRTNPIGNNDHTLAWLEQKSICQSWQAVWSFALIGVVFLLWMISMAVQVFYDDS